MLPEGAEHVATLFATHAAVAFRRARTEAQLNNAVRTRQVIGQAVGILMERYEFDEDRAFGFLARTSQDSNIKLREITQELVDIANRTRGETHVDGQDAQGRWI